MAWFEDLSPCTYFGAEYAAELVAVGWLEPGRPFSTGKTDAAVYLRLRELLREPWQHGLFMGVHSCDFCLYEGPSGSNNLFVPAGEFVFVCPELITHYMNAHAYLPPEAFCRAVVDCPPMRSMPYLKALRAGAKTYTGS